MKTIVHKLRSIIYFPVNFLQWLGAPVEVTIALCRVILVVDKPLRVYLLRGLR